MIGIRDSEEEETLDWGASGGVLGLSLIGGVVKLMERETVGVLVNNGSGEGDKEVDDAKVEEERLVEDFRLNEFRGLVRSDPIGSFLI